MASTPDSSPIAPPAPAPTLADVVTRHPERVSEVWCRRLLRHLLQALELQHAMRLHHAPLTPHAVRLNAQGDPLLPPPPAGPSAAAPAPDEAADAQALGTLIHFVITAEWPPAAPLQGRGLSGYSDSLLHALDRCTAADPAARPQSVAQLRTWLGIVSLQPPMPPMPLAAATSAAATATGHLPLHWQRWLAAGAAALVLLVAGAGLIVLLHDASGERTPLLTLPPADAPHAGLPLSGRPGTAANAPHPDIAATPPAAAPVDALPAPATPARRPAEPDAAAVGVAREASTAGKAGTALAPEQQARRTDPAQGVRSTSYRLRVRPWATVYVDGRVRGVTPPLKRLRLPAGPHDIRLVNPHYPDRVLRLEAGRARHGRIVYDFDHP